LQTELYRRQHGEILRHLDALDKLAAAAPEQEVCLELSRLGGVVKLHLNLEDKNLYPRMLEHGDPAVRATAEDFQRTMSDLAPIYVAFHEKWIRAGAVDSNRSQFAAEFRTVRDALRQRIDKENRGLYDVIDKNNILVAS
jgi:hemerythrin-like domain-containing protein